MKITILCSDTQHPIFPQLQQWMAKQSEHQIMLIERITDIIGGDILFLISCHEIIKQNVRDLYRYVLVIHASDLPADRGWSPHIWAILRGDNELTVSLLEAVDDVDCGRIYKKIKFPLRGTEVASEINQILFNAEFELMDWAISNIDQTEPQEQDEKHTNYLRRRLPSDSRLDPELSLASQFNLLRVADPQRYPAHFTYKGRTYKLQMTPMDKDQNKG